MVRRGGIEPPESVTPDLQSGPLPSTEYRRINWQEHKDLNLDQGFWRATCYRYTMLPHYLQ